jgi:EpsI family protein
MQAQHTAARNLMLVAALILLTALTYWPSSQALWEFWNNPTTAGAHGFLIAPLAGWLLYRRRALLAAAPLRPSHAALVGLALWSIAWLVFWRSGIQELHLLSLPLLMLLAVWAAFGRDVALISLVPLGYLYFAVPAWGIFIEPLEHLTAVVTGYIAPYIGVPAHRIGDSIYFPGGIIDVERGCSGQAFFTVGLAVAALIGELEDATLRRRAVLLVIMGALAILANWIRVLAIVDAGYETHMTHVWVTQSHYLFGWILFTIIMVLFVWFFARGLRTPALSRVSAVADPVGMKPAYASTLVALLAAPLLVYTLVMRLDASAGPLTFEAPSGQGVWSGPVAPAAVAWKPEFVGDHSQWYFAYQGATGHNVEMVAIGYPQQAQGRELVNEENSLFGAGGTELTAQTKVRLGDQSYIEISSDDHQGHRYLTWSVYDIGGREFVTPLLSQLWYGLRSLQGAPYSFQFAFRTACDVSSCDSARESLGSFVRTMGPKCLASVNGHAQPVAARVL